MPDEVNVSAGFLPRHAGISVFRMIVLCITFAQTELERERERMRVCVCVRARV